MKPVAAESSGQRPRCLELFAGGQGSAVGYARAGYEVHAFDSDPNHDKHPEVASFTVANAFDVLADTEFVRTFDLVTGGPPCKDHTDLATLAERAESTAWMLPTMILWCRHNGVPWVVENVDSAHAVRGELMLCGTMLGLAATCRDGERRQLQRHRRFAASEFLTPPGICQHRGAPVGVYGTGGGGQQTRGYKGHPEEAREAMGIDWMTRGELSQAIPPAYTQWIGEQMLDRLSTGVGNPVDAAPRK